MRVTFRGIVNVNSRVIGISGRVGR